ncbi:MAG TPA: FHA domain-containing protein, partial [Trebonia sp.]
MIIDDSGASGIGAVADVVAPDLLVMSDAGSARLRPGSAHRIGRDPQGAIVLGDPRVSWAHGELRSDGGTWVYADPSSTNGTWNGRDRVTRVEIGDRCVLRLGHPDDGPVLSLATMTAPADTGPVPTDSGDAVATGSTVGTTGTVDTSGAVDSGSPAHGGLHQPAGDLPTVLGEVLPYDPAERQRPGGPAPASIVALALGKAVRIGRARDNDLVVDDLGVSRRHAELRPLPAGGHQIVDAGSHNGTFVNGVRITAATVSELDIIGIGHSTFRIVGGELRQFLDEGEV